jgi:TetR/AcrR family transcriptional repressor of mexJK operon
MYLASPASLKMSNSIEIVDAKRDAIIQAATRLFLSSNYRSVSMDKIAQATPVSKATLYNHFDSKQALVAAVVTQLCASLLKTISQHLSVTQDAPQHLQNIATAFVDLLYSPDGLAIYRLLISESHVFPEFGEMAYQSGAEALNGLENYLQHLHESGLFYIPDPHFAADAFFSSLKGDLLFKCLLGIRPLPNAFEKKQLIESATDFFLRGINNVTK